MRPADRRKLPAANALGSAFILALLFVALGREIVETSAAQYCPDSQSEIQTDRPDVTNSSVVVPTGSLQAENGINLTGRRASSAIDGTNTRIRAGVAHCTELLVDLPDYFRPVHGRDPTGFSDVMPAVKVQRDVVFSATAGLGFPTGASPISGTARRANSSTRAVHFDLLPRSKSIFTQASD